MKKIFLSLLGTIFCACQTNSITPKENKFKVTSVIVTDTTVNSQYVAEIQALQNVEIRSRANGFIESILIDEGQFVRKDQILMVLNSKSFILELQKAKTAVQNAEAELNTTKIELINAEKLFDKKVISETELKFAKEKNVSAISKLEEAKVLVAQAEHQLTFATIKAPFDGYIHRIPNKVGSLVEEGTLLTKISNNKEVYAYFNISEKDYLDFVTSNETNKNNDVTLELANGKLYNYPGIIETSENEFDKNTGTIAFRAKFPNPDQILKHGSSGKILTKKALKNALLVPQKSTFEIQENVYVFVVDKNKVVHQQKIEVSSRIPQYFVIKSGLTENDQIVYEGIQQLKENDKILTELVSFKN